jgi:actin-like ATPase involved in cell morphogenesis
LRETGLTLFRRRVPVMVVVVPTASSTTFAAGAVRGSAPTAVAVDSAGRSFDFGDTAVLATARRGTRASLVVPFTHRRMESEAVAADYLAWLVGEAGCRRREAILAPIVAATGHESAARAWRRAASVAGLRSIVVSRPLAAAVGMDLDVESSTARLIIDLVDGTAEVSVIQGGETRVTRSCPGTEPADVAAVVRSILIQLDPDHEQDVVDCGISVIGEAIANGWREELERGAHLPVTAIGDGAVVLEGGRRTVEGLRPYLRRLVPGRPGFRVVPAGS